MTFPLLLDTNACIYIVEDTLADAARKVLEARFRAGEPVYVSPFTAWELACILRKGKLRSPLGADEYFRQLSDRPEFAVAPLTAEILIASWNLPGILPGDPADRIMVATARVLGFTLVTSDRALLAYAKEGHLSAVPC